MIRRPPGSTLFPSTTLFRSRPVSTPPAGAASYSNSPSTPATLARWRGSEMREQLVEHAGERADGDRQVSLALLEVEHRVRHPRRQPLRVGGGDHEVGGPLPDVRRDVVLGQGRQLEPPGPGEGHVVVEPAVDRRHTALEVREDVGADLAGE